MKYRIIALLSGIIFGAGLVVSGMTNPKKVVGFLNVLGDWDYDLAFVLASAVLVTVIGFRIVLKRDKPLLGIRFSLPQNQSIDKQLLLGASIFGIGWGLFGFCPGPALVALLYGNLTGLVFVAAMLTGMVLEKQLKPSDA